eukprot:TRINITY_DN5776_c0_g1_i1.p1 TRINITY_DN5776_c0_g1~~TRINITY_DN5776_c0_g1_i1.p1  ORF type:complete len:504 (-),score=223.62 TRINITY_DN5776_c0_g1_i1:166-1677(-)
MSFSSSQVNSAEYMIASGNMATVVDSEMMFNTPMPLTDYRIFTNLLAELKSAPTDQTLQGMIPILFKDKYRKQMRVEGGLQKILDIIARANPPQLTTIETLALICLALCCRNKPTKQEVRTKNGINLIATILRSVVTIPTGFNDAYSILQALKELAQYDKNREAIKASGAIDLICSHLVPTNYLLAPCLEVLAALASQPDDDRMKTTIAELGTIPHVVKAISQTHLAAPDPTLRRAATSALAALAGKSVIVKAEARKERGAMEAVAQLLQDPLEESRRAACLAVASLSEEDFTNQTNMVRLGVLDGLSFILSDAVNNSPETRRDACSALRAIVHSNLRAQTHYRSPEGLPKFNLLIESAGSGRGLDASAAMAQSSACLFGASAYSNDDDGAEDCTSGSGRLVGLRTQAINTLNELAKDCPPNCDYICASPVALQTLISSIAVDQHHLIQYAAASCIFTLSHKSPKRAVIFKNLGFVPILQQLAATSNDNRVKQGVSWALESLK